MEKRDKELEMDNNHRQKLWNDSIDQVNSNLVNIHNVINELEGSVNNLAHRQDQLVTLVEYTNEYCLFQREEPLAKEKPNISIPKFPPSLATFNLEPLNPCILFALQTKSVIIRHPLCIQNSKLIPMNKIKIFANNLCSFVFLLV